MSFRSDNVSFEKWLQTQCPVVDADLDYKHERMRKNPFVFLRATFFRWAKRIEKLCPELTDAPRVVSVGDTHTENFGTWRLHAAAKAAAGAVEKDFVEWTV